MKKVSLDEMREIQLAMLKDVHDFCQSHNIKYSLCGGTLLGAVRHKGYIPWDDDIDIMMLRPEYDRFVKEYVPKHSCCVLQTPDNDESYVHTFAKVYDSRTVLIEPAVRTGVYIDIFPMDGLSDLAIAKSLREEYDEPEYLMWQVSRLYKVKEMWLDRFVAYIKYCYHLIIYPSRDVILKKAKDICTRYSAGTSPYVCSLNGAYRERDVYPRGIFDEYIMLAFEGTEFCCIKDYDVYLSNLYGDYMQLPPIEKRVQHEHIVYWK